VVLILRKLFLLLFVSGKGFFESFWVLTVSFISVSTLPFQFKNGDDPRVDERYRIPSWCF